MLTVGTTAEMRPTHQVRRGYIDLVVGALTDAKSSYSAANVQQRKALSV